MKGGDFAKVDLNTLDIVKNFMKPKDIKKAVSIIQKHHKEFERKWDEYFS
ncbi:DUF4160 [Desulfonema limicola]|uniref:DUF4160 n=2 Tax=Desulfonema limicola TaxID=45656 RepID=A0A975BE84_9BACT|nr:DUF4160 [Desulfonema limicola]